MATLPELRADLRRRLDDQSFPYLWEDDELTAYLNEAEREAATRALLIRDTTTADVVNLTVAADAEWVDLHWSILKIEYAYIIDPVSGQKRQIREMGEDDLNESDGVRSAKGTPSRFVHVEPQIRLWPIPSAEIDVELIVRRLPLVDMADGTDPVSAPEIHRQHHYRMLDWAIRCAYLKRDSDAYDEKLAAKHEALFEASFGTMNDANVRRKHNQKQKDTTTPINF